MSLLERILGNSLAPFRFLTPFSIRPFLVWRRLYGEKTVIEAERARFLSAGEESEALIRVAFDSLGQKQRVFEPYSLSLLQWSLQLFPKTYSLNIITNYQ
jgi:hypothetical protein